MALAARATVTADPPLSEQVGTVLPPPAFRRPSPSGLDCTVGADGKATCGDCLQDTECPKGTGCAVNPKTRRTQCVSNECEKDEQCSGDTVCRVATMGLNIRRCVPPGTALGGERCRRFPASLADQCQEGLFCVHGYCGTPCTKGRAGTCKDAEACIDGSDGPACAPASCHENGCPDSERCIETGPETFACVQKTVGENCMVNPCRGKDDVCQLSYRGSTIAFQCVAACSPLDAKSCAAGFVCGQGEADGQSVCYRACSASDPKTCSQLPGLECITVTEDTKVWGCSY
jgi:hypothetical protein